MKEAFFNKTTENLKKKKKTNNTESKSKSSLLSPLKNVSCLNQVVYKVSSPHVVNCKQLFYGFV